MIVTVFLTHPVLAVAQSYLVQAGDTLSTIAQAHGVPTEELARLNKILDTDHIEAGQTLTLPSTEGRVVENGVLHSMMRGVTLRRIAQAYEVPLKQLVRANRIRNPDLVRRGREILVPGAKRVIPIATRYIPPCLSDPVEVYRIHTNETLRVVLTKCDGSIWEPGREKVSRFLDRTVEQNAPELDTRLLQLIQQVYLHFGKRRIEVVSAYRPPIGEQRASSRHCKAKALDFRVAGVRNETLRDYVRSFDRTGVGYYPNSTFVHLDVRDRRGFWVDWSGPGEPARYGTFASDPALRRSASADPSRILDRESATTPLSIGRQRRHAAGASSTSPGTAGAP